MVLTAFIGVIIIVFTSLMSYYVLRKKEHFQCLLNNGHAIYDLITPLPFEPTEKVSKNFMNTPLFDLSNKAFSDIFGKQNSFIIPSKLQTIGSEIIKNELLTKISRYVMRVFSKLSESGYQYVTGVMVQAKTDDRDAFCSCILVLHIPSTAYAKVIRVDCVIAIFKGQFKNVYIQLIGNIIASNIDQIR